MAYDPIGNLTKRLAYLKSLQNTPTTSNSDQVPRLPKTPAAPTPSLPQPLQVPQVPNEVYNASPAVLQGLTNAAVPPQASSTSLYSHPTGIQGNLVSSAPQANSMWESTPQEQADLQAKRQYWNTDSVLEGLRNAQQFGKKPQQPIDPLLQQQFLS